MSEIVCNHGTNPILCAVCRVDSLEAILKAKDERIAKLEKALKIAREALEKISKFSRIDWLTDEDNATEEADLASKAQQKINEILIQVGKF